MNKPLLAFLFLISPVLTQASEPMYFEGFLSQKDSGTAYKKLIAGKKLPAWVNSGGTSSAAHDIKVDGKNFVGISGCEANNCSEKKISVIYSKDENKMYGVYSEFSPQNNRETLLWLGFVPSSDFYIREALLDGLTQ